jgi:hypothetical protein
MRLVSNCFELWTKWAHLSDVWCTMGSSWEGGIFFFLVNKRNMKVVRFARNLSHIVWTEFQTQFQFPGLSLKLSPRFFFTFMYYIKNKAQRLIDWSKNITTGIKIKFYKVKYKHD